MNSGFVEEGDVYQSHTGEIWMIWIWFLVGGFSHHCSCSILKFKYRYYEWNINVSIQ